MRHRVAVSIVAALFAVVMGFLWLGAKRAEAQARAALRAATSQRDMLANEAGRILQQLAADATLAAKARTQVSSTVAERHTAANPRPPDTALMVDSDPSLRDLNARRYRASLSVRFGPAYRALKLSSDQIRKIEDQAVASFESAFDIRAAAAAHGVSPKDSTIAELQKQNGDQFLAAVAAQLGPETAAALDRADRAAPVADLVDEIAGTIGVDAPALTGEQRDRLGELLARSTADFEEGGKADPASVDWNRALAEAAAVLSPEQLRALSAEAASKRLRAMAVGFARGERRTSP